MEALLVRELYELKHEILRQMEITEKLTDQAKGNRKSYIEVENSNLIKLRKEKEEKKHKDYNAPFKEDCVENAIANDSDIVNEVTVTTEETTQEDSDKLANVHITKDDDDESKNLKNTGKVKVTLNWNVDDQKKKNDDGIIFDVLK